VTSPVTIFPFDQRLLHREFPHSGGSPSPAYYAGTQRKHLLGGGGGGDKVLLFFVHAIESFVEHFCDGAYL
jgi:hypothetical protein